MKKEQPNVEDILALSNKEPTIVSLSAQNKQEISQKKLTELI